MSTSDEKSLVTTTENELQTMSRREADQAKRALAIRAVFGEFVCTSLFMYCASAIPMNLQQSTPSFLGGPLATGMAVVAMIYSFADISGAHFNPAVTFATVVMRKTSPMKGVLYVIAQLLGATFASIFLLCTFPQGVPLVYSSGTVVPPIGSELPKSGATPVSTVHAFFMEFTLSFILLYVVFAIAFDVIDTKDVQMVVPSGPNGTAKKFTSTDLTIYTADSKDKSGFAGISVGFLVIGLSMAGSTISGACFNPSRAFGASLISGRWDSHWLFWVADCLGAAAGAWVQSFFKVHREKKNSNPEKKELEMKENSTVRI